jgi:hypothetical protein
MRRDDLDELIRLRELEARGALPAEEGTRLAALVGALLDAGAAAQRTRPGSSRRGMRGRRAVPVSVGWSQQEHRGITLDVGTGGFAALLGVAPPTDSAVVVALDLGRAGRVVALARAVDARVRHGTARVSFAFFEMEPRDEATLRAFLVDDAIAELRQTPGALRATAR